RIVWYSMDHHGIESVLAAAEERLAAGESLAGTGFRRVVATVKTNPELAERYAARIARIDDAAFRRWPMLVIPIVPGTIIAVLVTLIGVALVGWTYRLVDDGRTAAALVDDGRTAAALVAFLAGFVVLLGSTHGLGHLLVGRLLGIRFTAWF